MTKYCPICEDGELEFVAELYRCQRCGEELKAPNKPAEAELMKLMELQNNRIEILKVEIERLSSLLHDEMSQLQIASDLGNKRWIALNEIYENGERHNANWCRRKAQEGLGIKND